MILRGQVDFVARSQSPTAYRRSPSAPGPSVAARHLPTLWGVTLYTRGPLGLRVGVCEVARADMESAPTVYTKVGAFAGHPPAARGQQKPPSGNGGTRQRQWWIQL